MAARRAGDVGVGDVVGVGPGHVGGVAVAPLLVGAQRRRRAEVGVDPGADVARVVDEGVGGARRRRGQAQRAGLLQAVDREVPARRRRGRVARLPDAAAEDMQHAIAVEGIDLHVVDPAGETVAGRRVRHGGRDLAPVAAAVVGQLHHLLAAVVAPGAAHAQRDARRGAGAEDRQAAVAGAIVAVEQRPGVAVAGVVPVEPRGAGVARAGALAEEQVQRAVGGAHDVGDVEARHRRRDRRPGGAAVDRLVEVGPQAGRVDVVRRDGGPQGPRRRAAALGRGVEHQVLDAHDLAAQIVDLVGGQLRRRQPAHLGPGAAGVHAPPQARRARAIEQDRRIVGVDRQALADRPAVVVAARRERQVEEGPAAAAVVGDVQPRGRVRRGRHAGDHVDALVVGGVQGDALDAVMEALGRGETVVDRDPGRRARVPAVGAADVGARVEQVPGARMEDQAGDITAAAELGAGPGADLDRERLLALGAAGVGVGGRGGAGRGGLDGLLAGGADGATAAPAPAAARDRLRTQHGRAAGLERGRGRRRPAAADIHEGLDRRRRAGLRHGGGHAGGRQGQQQGGGSQSHRSTFQQRARPVVSSGRELDGIWLRPCWGRVIFR